MRRWTILEMITVRTEVRPSPKHGNGLFLLEPVAKNTAVYYFNPNVDLSIPLKDANDQQVHFGYVCTLTPTRLSVCGDDARWWNFSDSASETNCIESSVVLNGEPVIVASRYIAVGEELLIDQDTDALAQAKLGKPKS